MNFSRKLFTFFTYFAYFTLSHAFDDVHWYSHVMDSHPEFLAVEAWTAASAGRSFFKMPQNLSEDCVRTAKVTMDLYLKPSTFDIRHTRFRVASIDNAAEDVASNTTLIDPMEWFCKHLNKEFKENRSATFPNFEELKKNVNLPKPASSYFVELPAGLNLSQAMKKVADSDIRIPFNDPAFIKYNAVANFYPNLPATECYKKNIPHISISETIVRMSENKTLQNDVDRVFLQALDDYVNDLQIKCGNNTNKMDADMVSHTFNFKVDENFRKDDAVKTVYEELKKIVTDRMNKNATCVG